jgi:hypothetical protein
MAVTVLAGYPQSTGAKVMATARVTGPTAYAAGGFQVLAVSLGLKYIESAYVSTEYPSIALTDLFAVTKLNNTGPAGNALYTTVGVHTVATGVEVVAGVNLSTRNFIVTAVGYI